MKKIVSILIFISFNPCYSQNKEELFNRFIDQVAMDLDNETDILKIYDYYFQLFEYPINLNDCRKKDLEALNILTETEIHRILDSRKTHGHFSSLYELGGRANLSEGTFIKIYPFLVVKEKARPIKFSSSETSILASRVMFVKPKSQVLGDLNRIKFRSYLDLSRLKLSFSLKKDPGEQLSWNPANDYYLFEHLSGYISYSLNRFITLNAGNFEVRSGSGLILDSNYLNSKSVNPILFSAPVFTILRPTNSLLEQASMSGISAQINPGKLSFIPFLSFRKLNGTVRKDDSIINISSDVNMDTQGSLDKRKQISLLEYGFSTGFRASKIPLELGVNFIQTQFNRGIEIEQDYYSKSIPLKSNTAYSTYLTYGKNGIKYWFEAAFSNLNLSYVTGLNLSLNRQADLTLGYRNFNKSFRSFHTSAPSHFSSALDEEAVYLALRLKLPNFVINGYHDLVRSRNPRYQIKAPSYHIDRRVKITYETKVMIFESWWRNRSFPVSISDNANIQPVQNLTQNEWVSQILFKSNVFEAKTRIGYKIISERLSKNGSYIFQQIKLKYRALKFLFRFTVFDSQSYINRFYVYENDVFRNARNRLLSGNGYQAFILTGIKMTNKIKLEVKWSYMEKYNVASIPSTRYVNPKPALHQFTSELIIRLD